MEETCGWGKGWIPEEVKPLSQEPVLTYAWDGEMAVGEWNGSRWLTNRRYQEDVLFWMPLPESPKGK